MSKITLTPLDVGSDLRVTGHAIIVGKDVTEAKYDDGGKTKVVRGSREIIVAALKTAGYTIAEEK